MSESTQPLSAAEVDAAIEEHAEAFEVSRRQRARDLAAEREKKAKRTDRQFWFLFVVLFLGLSLLAYRTEVNNNAVKANAHLIVVNNYQACVTRVDRQIQANVGRETLVQLAADSADPPLTPEQREQRIQRLRDALLLPVEDCGPPVS
jgi:hypothetical protein